ncbi:AMP-binding protein [Methylotuvimicrobium buryatense]|uniref:AMP-dependent synthetase n=1 Tax=Methylotuvimicrobium buryatense TaxID=95641 RepID=A0A4P9UJB4_METBY|nr:AMP-binding protein [Methylotuvimicrobium buryatense]QCW81158.1 AMP-dependent synthetase [Methylotuvimicrobium buryatense]
MCAEPIPLSRCALPAHPERTVAVHTGQMLDRQRFCADVAAVASALQHQAQPCYALYHEDCYPFAVLLFALWHAGKKVVIPGNNCPATADELAGQGCALIGAWHGRESILASPAEVNIELHALNPADTSVTLFTSGSNGRPKAIVKTLPQLQREVDALEAQWGLLLGVSAAAATVSHQHIYGLLFRLLWPLASGRCFHSQLFLSPEPMLKALAGQPAYWVASPAQLKRLDELTDWAQIAKFSAIFSSGGPLPPDAAAQIERLCGQRVIEVYGSSETGGIAWRRSAQDTRWTPFAGIGLSRSEDGRCLLTSPYLPDASAYPMDDRIELHNDGRFSLLGRLDRIVKVEEKRLSLDALENALSQSDWVEQSHCLLLSNRRDRVAAAIVLTESGLAALRYQGRAAIFKSLRRQLQRAFESVVLPRKWLFFDSLPMTRQGKLDHALLRQLFALDSAKYPQLLYCRIAINSAELEFRIQPELVYFNGHFPGMPILPGVTQLAWAEHYGKLFFSIEQPFLTMEAVKFKKIILPDALIKMALEWRDEAGKLYFDLSSVSESHSSGRMLYGARP